MPRETLRATCNVLGRMRDRAGRCGAQGVGQFEHRLEQAPGLDEVAFGRDLDAHFANPLEHGVVGEIALARIGQISPQALAGQ